MALLNLHFDFAAWMIEAGADVNKWDLYGRTPLYLAADTNTLPVMGNGGPVAIPAADKVEIGLDGNITVILQGQGLQGPAVVDRIKLVNPDLAELSKGEDGELERRDLLRLASEPPLLTKPFDRQILSCLNLMEILRCSVYMI